MKAKHESIKNHIPKGLLTFVVAAILLASIVPIASAGWDCRKPVTINNPGDALSDYQVLVTLNSPNFDYSKANPDGSDMRFTDYENSMPCPYWVETWNTSGESRIWVNVFSISTGDSKMYVWYNNSEASSVSNGDDTFEFFDDFEGMRLDSSKWMEDVVNNIDHSINNHFRFEDAQRFGVENYWIYDGTDTGSQHQAKWIPLDAFIVEWNANVNDVGVGEMGQGGIAVIAPDSTIIYYAEYADGDGLTVYLSRAVINEAGYTYSLRVNRGDEAKFAIVRDGYNYEARINDVSVDTYTSTTPASEIALAAGAYGGYPFVDYIQINDVIVRKYADPEPTTVVGVTEEDVTGPVDPVTEFIPDTDADGDGVPNVWDMDNSTPTEYWTDRQGVGRIWGDMNGDGELTSVDALMILQAAADAISL